MLCIRLAFLVCFCTFKSAVALDDFLGPTDPTGQIDFSDGTACACPGSPVQYLCTVSDPSGSSFTLWRGTAFDCTGSQAGLFHNQYTSGSAAIACNDGNFNLTAHGLTNVTGNCYTSVLTVNIEPGLNGRTVECTSAGSRTIGNDTLRVAVPLPPPSTPQLQVDRVDPVFTVSWAPPTAECGNAVTYTYPGQPASMCGQCTGRSDTPSVTCRGWTAQGQSCSITARADNCAGMGSESQPVVISFPRPTAPSITGGEVVFDQSRESATITVEWDPVVPTDAIAVSGVAVLVDGAIRDYLVNFTTGQGVPVEVTCSNTTCASPELPTDPDGGASFFIRVLARNAITVGDPGQALCTNFQVERLTGSSLLDVTLTCPVAGCTIRYGLDPTYQTLPSEGRSGEPLQNLTAGETYYTEATFICGGLTVHVRDTFDTCECSSSGLFAGAATEAATCPQEFTGGVRTSSSNGIACYSGLTADSTAVFMCGVDGANCTGSCEAVCVCSPEQTRGEWSASFEELECSFANTPEPPLSTPETAVVVTAGIVVGVVIPVIGLLIFIAVLVSRSTYCKGRCFASAVSSPQVGRAEEIELDPYDKTKLKRVDTSREADSVSPTSGSSKPEPKKQPPFQPPYPNLIAAGGAPPPPQSKASVNTVSLDDAPWRIRAPPPQQLLVVAPTALSLQGDEKVFPTSLPSYSSTRGTPIATTAVQGSNSTITSGRCSGDEWTVSDLLLRVGLALIVPVFGIVIAAIVLIVYCTCKKTEVRT